jgi:hypothetical protein
MAMLSQVLREAVRTGDFGEVGPLLAEESIFDSSSERGRFIVRGRDAILAHLSGPGPGEVVDWQAEDWDSGCAVSFEWRGQNSVDRRRWYVRRKLGEIVAWRSYAARPRGEPGTGVEVPAGVLEGLGPGARRADLEHSGNSGAALERIVLADGSQLIAKRVGPGADWLGRVTRDRGRTALLWEAGAFERMPDDLDHGIQSVVPDGDGWWVVMRDLSATFLGDERRISREESRRILAAAAAMYREFAGESLDGATTLADRLGMASPRIAESERDAPDLLPKQLEAAWDAFAEAVPDDVAAEVIQAARDTTALAAALLEAGPQTLIHGDLRDDNLGLDGDRIVLLDWDLATTGTPTVELAWYLCHDTWRIDATTDVVEADFREAEGYLLNDREVELGILSGLVQYGWIFGHSLLVHPDPAEQEWARTELDWWIPRTRRALEAVGGMPE